MVTHHAVNDLQRSHEDNRRYCFVLHAEAMTAPKSVDRCVNASTYIARAVS